MLETICVILVILGAIITVIDIFLYNKILIYSEEHSVHLPRYYGVIKNVIRIMMFFFICGFTVGAYDVITNDELNPMFLFVIIVFFVAAIFMSLILVHMYFLTRALIRNTDDLNEALSKIEENNMQLQEEVDVQVNAILEKDILLDCVNRMATKMLSSNTNIVGKFEETIEDCLKDLGETSRADRVSVWKNYERHGRLYCKILYEWKGSEYSCKKNSLSDNIPYDEFMKSWKQVLGSGKNISSLVRDLSEVEREIVIPKGVLSILIVPIFLHGHFWGYIGFEDCYEEREFDIAEEGILKSAGAMIANSIVQNDNMKKLIKAREEALLSARSKSDFLSNMSHEIRTPINAITGMTNIAMNSDDDGEMQKCLEQIDTSSKQLLALINDILDISKIEAGKMDLDNDTFDLYNTIANVEAIMGVKAEEKSQTFEVSITDDVPKLVRGDSIRISQILLNLLSNAIKFTDEGGEISMEIDVEIYLSETDTYKLKAVVKDNGIGIDEKLMPNLFVAFEQAEKTTSRRYGGTGLGLTISKNIAELMNGNITVVSQPGEGSSFTATFEIKRGYEEDIAKEETAQAAEFDLGGRGVMVVDDIEINREIVESILGEKDMNVYSFENGKDAVDAYSKDPEKYELILMDIHMPLMDGYEATKIIRDMENGSNRKVPIVAMTANAFGEDIIKCKDAGMNDHVAKPVDYDRLFQLMDHYLNHRE